MMLSSGGELYSLIAVIIVLMGLFVWLRIYQNRAGKERQRKLRCKEIILDRRVKLARAGVDFDRLVDLVRLKINPEQLETVLELLTAPPVYYNIEEGTEQGIAGVDLDFGLGDEGGGKDEQEKQTEPSGQAGPLPEKMTPEEEAKWLRVAHTRFRAAVSRKELTDRQSRLRLLVKMVELGKQAVEKDPDKDPKRREYELSVWDKFYENEYIELQSE